MLRNSAPLPKRNSVLNLRRASSPKKIWKQRPNSSVLKKKPNLRDRILALIEDRLGWTLFPVPKDRCPEPHQAPLQLWVNLVVASVVSPVQVAWAHLQPRQMRMHLERSPLQSVPPFRVPEDWGLPLQQHLHQVDWLP